MGIWPSVFAGAVVVIGIARWFSSRRTKPGLTHGFGAALARLQPAHQLGVLPQDHSDDGPDPPSPAQRATPTVVAVSAGQETARGVALEASTPAGSADAFSDLPAVP